MSKMLSCLSDLFPKFEVIKSNTYYYIPEANVTGWMDFLGKPFFKEHGNCLWTTIIEYMKTVETDFRQQDNINFFLLEMSSFFLM